MLGYLSLIIAPAALQLEALSVMTWMTLYGPIWSIVSSNVYAMLMAVLNLSEYSCAVRKMAPLTDTARTLINGLPFTFVHPSDTMDTPLSVQELVILFKDYDIFAFS